MFSSEDSYAPFHCRGRASGCRSTAVQMPLLPEYCRKCAVTLCHAYRHSADNLLSSHAALLAHICPHTVYNNTVAIVPTWCNRAVRILLYVDVESSFLAARVLSYDVFLPPEYRHSLSNATNVYLGQFCLIFL